MSSQSICKSQALPWDSSIEDQLEELDDSRSGYRAHGDDADGSFFELDAVRGASKARAWL